MEKLKLLLLMVLSQFSIVSFAQSPELDSTKTYTKSELRQIAFKLIEGKECCQLLQISEQASFYKNRLITSQDSILGLQNEKLKLQDELIEKFKVSQISYEKELKKSKTKGTIMKVGWPITLIAVLTTVLLTR